MKKISYLDIFTSFLKIGALGFGGPVGLIAQIEKEFVFKRSLITTQVFQQKYVISKLLPGPVAFQMALNAGHELRGRLGGFIAGLGFLIPGALLILLISIFYGQFSTFSSYQAISSGLQIGALLIIIDSIYKMARPQFRTIKTLLPVVLAGILMALLPSYEPIIILSFGALAVFLHWAKGKKFSCDCGLLLSLFFVHFKAAWIVFGTGLAVIPVLQQDIVNVHAWVSPEVFLDGILFGQITPGPVTITSVFIGYQIASFIGAFVAMAGMYLPGVIIVLFLLPPLEKKIMSSSYFEHFQKAAFAAVVGCILVSIYIMYSKYFIDPKNILIFLLLGVSYRFFKMPILLAIPVGGFLKYIL